MIRASAIVFFLGFALAPLLTQASGDPANNPGYWVQDSALQEAISDDGVESVEQWIKTTVESGAQRLNNANWQPLEQDATALARAMRWAVIREMDNLLPALNTIATAPPGLVPVNWHYALTYNGRWAAWLIRMRDQSPQQRVAKLISIWRDEAATLRQRSFAEDRLVDEPQAAEALVTLTVEEVLPRAGTFKNKILHIDDVEAAGELGRLESILAVQAQRSAEAREIIERGLSGTPLAGIINLDR